VDIIHTKHLKIDHLLNKIFNMHSNLRHHKDNMITLKILFKCHLTTQHQIMFPKCIMGANNIFKVLMIQLCTNNKKNQ
jgi:hypothetical protein